MSSAATGGGVTASNTGASITSNVLTTTDADATGTVAVGQVVTGTGVPAGTYIASADGTGSGTHLWNLANVDGTAIPNLTSQTMNFQGSIETQFYVAQNAQAPITSTTTTISSTGLLTTGGAVSGGTIQAGQFVTGTGVPANTEILYQVSGTAGAGGGATYQTNAVAAVTSFTASFAGGLLARISSWTRST